MLEIAPPALVDPPRAGNLADIVYGNAVSRPESAAFSRRVSDTWAEVSNAEFWDDVRGVAKGLIAAGMNPGDRVAIMSRTRYEWALVDFAVWVAGAVSVTLYETATAEYAAWVLDDAKCVLAVVETAREAALLRSVQARTPTLRNVVTIDEVVGGDAATSTGTSTGTSTATSPDTGTGTGTGTGTQSLAQLVEAGQHISDHTVNERRTTATPSSLATILYTSGTTGHPKGCELTHANLLFLIRTLLAGAPELFRHDGACALLFIPLAHVFARLSQLACVMAGVRLGHTANVSALTQDLRDFSPTVLIAVPRTLENLYNQASQRAQMVGRGSSFDRATETAIAVSKSERLGRLTPIRRAEFAVYDRRDYARVRQALGGRTKYIVCGGAPLGERLGHFFNGIGIDVLEGYGLTETSGATSVNRPGAVRIGTVGQVLPGTAVRIADDGEVLVRGPHVMRGYHADPTASAAVIDPEGWLFTGDLGELDDDGYLTILGRKTELIHTTAGEVLSPIAVEDAVQAHPLVSHCMVLGDGQPFVTALLTLDREALSSWAQQQEKAHSTPGRLRTDPDLLAELQHAIDDANTFIDDAELSAGTASDGPRGIRRFRVLGTDWTETAGQLTPSMKLKRNVVLRDFAYDVERLYD